MKIGHGDEIKKQCLAFSLVLVLLPWAGMVLADAPLEGQLIKAVGLADVRQVKNPLDKGANINAKNPDGLTALMVAAFNGHLDVVKQLVEKGADLNERANSGWTALMCAAVEGRTDVARFLLEKGADVNKRDNKGMTALMMSTRTGSIEVVKVLLDKGADVNLKDYWGNTAYTLASQRGHAQIATLLKDTTAKSNTLVMILGTLKLIVIVIILAIIIRIGHDRPLHERFFEEQKWRLNDAYKIVIPLLALVYLQFILHYVLPQYGSFFSAIFGPLYCIIIYGGYYFFIKKVYGVSAIVFGLDRAKFLKSGVRNANIAIILSLLVIILQSKDNLVYLVPAFSTFTKDWVPADIIRNANNYMNLISVYLLVLAVFVIPVFEELLFRGILFTPVARRIGMWKAIGLLSVFGALGHLHFNIETIGGVVLWFLLYWIYVRSASLYGSIIWHMAFNFMLLRYAGVLASDIDGNTLDKYYTCGLLLLLLFVNSVWLAALLIRKLPSAKSKPPYEKESGNRK